MSTNEQIVRKFFEENPHEIDNELYGDGISLHGDRTLQIRGVHINHYNTTIAHQNQKIVAKIAEELKAQEKTW